MKGLKTTLISILAVGLLAGSAVGVAAQDDEAIDPMRASTFKWDFSGPPAQIIDPTVTETENGQSVRGLAFVDHQLKAGDPRASGLYTMVQNYDQMGRIRVVRVIARLVNDAGAWSGPATSTLRLEKGETASFVNQTGMAMLTGEGDYEGLTLIFTQTLDDQRGYIIPTDLLPPLPELPAELPAE